MKLHSINQTGNTKTGNMLVTSSTRQSCPDTCPLKDDGGCYAENSHSKFQWNKIDNGDLKSSVNFLQLTKAIKRLPMGALWRHNEKGDLLHNDGAIDKASLQAIVKANKGKNGFTYTHHNMTDENASAIKEASNNGFTINASANDIEQADNYIEKGLNTVVIMPLGSDKVSYTNNGNKVVLCPANKDKNIQCTNCQLCQRDNRGFIIGFEAHGTRKKKVDIIAKSL